MVQNAFNLPTTHARHDANHQRNGSADMIDKNGVVSSGRRDRDGERGHLEGGGGVEGGQLEGWWTTGFVGLEISWHYYSRAVHWLLTLHSMDVIRRQDGDGRAEVDCEVASDR